MSSESSRFRTYGLVASPLHAVGSSLCSQAILLRPIWWIASACATLLWCVLAWRTGLAPAWVAPPLVVIGLAYSFRGTFSPAMEMELSCPVRPVEMVLVRTLLVMTWVAALGLAGSGGLMLLVGKSSDLSSALSSWLAGMLMFGGATVLVLLVVGPHLALGLALSAWLGLVLWHSESNFVHPIWEANNRVAVSVGLACLVVSFLMGRRLLLLPPKEG